MKKFPLTAFFSLLLVFMSSITNAADKPRINYHITFPEAQAHYADIELTVTGLKQASLNLKMPVWAPGSYLVREFARNVETLSVSAKGKNLPAVKTRKNIWHVNTVGQTAITVKYRVYAFEVSVRTSFIDASYAFLSSPDMFIYPEGMLNEPSAIKITPYKNWTTVSTSLEKVNGDQFTRTAPNYDILFDSPLEIGNQDVFGFKVGNTDYEVAMTGGGNYDKDRIKNDLAKLIAEEVKIFGENPNKHYTFIVHNYLKGGGGLEHLSSTTLGASRMGYTNEKTYQGFLSLAAHEHFHLWNVKRLRPIALGPFDYDNENYTTNLWIAEGFTAYYQDIIVRRTQLYPANDYVSSLGAKISAVENQPGTRVQPLSQASYDAWIKYYRPNENSNNTTISYYNKGAMVALLLDLDIINATKGKSSLDDVMKYAYNEYYKVKKRGYTDDEFKLALEKFAGKKLDSFYDKYINGLDALDYDKYLGYAGYKLEDSLAGTNEPYFGVNYLVTSTKAIVASVVRNSAAWKDGINVNDEIIDINGKPITKTTVISGSPGDVLNVTVIRDGLKLTIPVTLQKSTLVKYKLAEVANPTPGQLAVRKKWLSLQ